MASSLSWARGPQRGSEGLRATLYTCTWSMRPPAGDDLAHPLDPGRDLGVVGPRAVERQQHGLDHDRPLARHEQQVVEDASEGQARAVHELEVGLAACVQLAPELVELGERGAHLRLVEERRVREQPQRHAGGEAVAQLADRARGCGELRRCGRLAVAREGDVGHPPQLLCHAVERRQRPEIAAARAPAAPRAPKTSAATSIRDGPPGVVRSTWQ